MDQINSTIQRQIEQKDLNINKGVAIDARLVKSASCPVSNKKLRALRKKHNTPHYGLKEHAAVDVNRGFILATTMTPPS